jgi:hypothetical protein
MRGRGGVVMGAGRAHVLSLLGEGRPEPHPPLGCFEFISNYSGSLSHSFWERGSGCQSSWR